jgi:hypothetical protein
MAVKVLFQHFPEGTRESQEIHVRLFDLWAKIQMQDLQNVKQEC